MQPPLGKGAARVGLSIQECHNSATPAAPPQARNIDDREPAPRDFDAGRYPILAAHVFGGARSVNNPHDEPRNGDARAAVAFTLEAAPFGQAGWLLNTDETAKVLGLSPHTLSKWRITGNGPPFHLLGRRCLYSPDDLRRWTATKIRTSTSDQGTEAS